MTLVVYPKQSFLAGATAGSLAFTATCVGLLAFGKSAQPWKEMIACYSGGVFFGACSVFFAIKLVENRPSITIKCLQIVFIRDKKLLAVALIILTNSWIGYTL